MTYKMSEAVGSDGYTYDFMDNVTITLKKSAISLHYPLTYVRVRVWAASILHLATSTSTRPARCISTALQCPTIRDHLIQGHPAATTQLHEPCMC